MSVAGVFEETGLHLVAVSLAVGAAMPVNLSLVEMVFGRSSARHPLLGSAAALPLCRCCCLSSCVLQWIKGLSWVISSLAKEKVIFSLDGFAKLVRCLATRAVVPAHQTAWCRGGSKYW